MTGGNVKALLKCPLFRFPVLASFRRVSHHRPCSFLCIGHFQSEFAHRPCSQSPLTIYGWLLYHAGHGQGSPRSVQRRRDRYYHHDYGAGNEGAARRELCCIAAVAARFPQLCAELLVCRHLLEQSPPHAARHDSCHRVDSVGESALALLAVTIPICDRLDGPESFCTSALCHVRFCLAHGRRRIFYL